MNIHIFTPNTYSADFEMTDYGKTLFTQYVKSDWVLGQEKKKENTTPMANETMTRPFKLAENNRTEHEMDVKLTSGIYGTKVRVAGEADKELKDFFESAKTGDSFLLVLVKQSKG